MSFWTSPIDAAKIAVSAADDGYRLHRGRGQHEQRIRTRHHIHASSDHGRGMNQRRNRRRTFHRIGQPDVQRKLCRLAACADKQKQRRGGDDGIPDAEMSATCQPIHRGVIH